MTTAGASLLTPGALFALPVKAEAKTIAVPAGAHPAMMSAAKILAKKLELEESAIATYDGAPKSAAGTIVFALANGWEAGQRSTSRRWMATP